MAKNFLTLLIAVIFLLTGSFFGLCLAIASPDAPDCCPSNISHHSSNSEDCFSHCTKQKPVAVKKDGPVVEGCKIKTPFFLEKNVSLYFYSILHSLKPGVDYYVYQASVKLGISHIYFIAIFNHAPPPF